MQPPEVLTDIKVDKAAALEEADSAETTPDAVPTLEVEGLTNV